MPTKEQSDVWCGTQARGVVRSRRGRPGARRRRGTSGARTSPSARGGRCARTTAPDGEAWDYFPHDHARSRAYRWGEDGMAGVCDVGQQPVHGARAVERTRPDPQGADVRPDRAAGQPRRGRQGVLVVPRRRCPATPGCAGATTTRRPSSPTPTWWPRTPGVTRASPSTSCWTPASFDDDRYWVVEVDPRQGRPARPAHGGQRHQRRPGDGDAPRAATPVVPQHLVLGRRGRTARSLRTGGPAQVAVDHPRFGELTWELDAGPDGSAPDLLFCDNDTNLRRLYGSPESAGVPQGRDQRPRRRRRRDGEPGRAPGPRPRPGTG